MNKLVRISALALCAATAFGPAAAEDKKDARAERKAERVVNKADDKVSPDLGRASKLIGTDVIDAKGEKLGDIKDIVLDRRRGDVAYAVVGFGGTLGVGDKYFAIPWQALKPREDKLVLNVDREKLKDAPGFDKDNWPDMASRKWNTDTARYYGQAPYWDDRVAARREVHRERMAEPRRGERDDRSSGSSGNK